MKTILLRFLTLATLALYFPPPAHAQTQVMIEASAADVTAGLKGAPFYISPRRLGSVGGLTATYVGYGSGAGALTGESAFNYNATTNTLAVENLTLAGTQTMPGGGTITGSAGTLALTPAGSANVIIGANALVLPTGTTTANALIMGDLYFFRYTTKAFRISDGTTTYWQLNGPSGTVSTSLQLGVDNIATNTGGNMVFKTGGGATTTLTLVGSDQSATFAGNVTAATTATKTLGSSSVQWTEGWFGKTGLTTTSVDGVIIQSAQVATAGTPVRISPRLRLASDAYNSTSTLSEQNTFIIENLPATVAGTTTATLKVGYRNETVGGAYSYPMQLTSVGALTVINSLGITGGAISLSDTAVLSLGVNGDAVVQNQNGGASSRLVLKTKGIEALRLNNDQTATFAGAVTTGNLTIGAGTAITKVLSATATLDFPDTATQAVADLTITVTGAAVGDTVARGVPHASTTATSVFDAWVSASDTVTVRFAHTGSGSENPASGTFRATVIKF